jgi:hypothetical protein
MDSLKHVEMLAYGLGSDMLSEIKNEVASIEATLADLSISIQDLRPESQFAMKRMGGYIQEAERISSSLFNYEKRIGDIKRISGIKEIQDLEAELSLPKSHHEISRLKRQIHHLKSIHSRKLSNLISTQQLTLQERLRLVNIWKSILNYEIHILDECRTQIIRNIVLAANSSADSDTIDMVRERLKSLSVKDSIVSELKLDMSAVKIANIHILHKTLVEQLNDIGRIESAVEEKRQVVQILNVIAADIRDKMIDAPPEEPSAMPPFVAESAKETITDASPPSSSQGPASRIFTKNS